MEFSTKLIDLDLNQIHYLIDLVFQDIENEKRDYENKYNRYDKKQGNLSNEELNRIHNVMAMEQHIVIKLLYVLSQLYLASDISSKKSNKPKKELPKTLDSYQMQEVPEEMLNGFDL